MTRHRYGRFADILPAPWLLQKGCGPRPVWPNCGAARCRALRGLPIVGA
ncbi:MAG: hypothetical protein HLUCCA24_00400, partial [Rhodobacteraceae bacterium HLUCCA24]